jgi:hypothetical protein
MKHQADAIATVVESFKQRGFRYVGTTKGCWVRLTGTLRTTSAVHDCEIDIDPQFFELPRIRLVVVPEQLQPVAPHLSNEGGLCYLAKGSVVLDIFDPVGQSLACLKQAEGVLDKLLKKELVQDLEEEFFALWDGPLCLVDIQEPKLGKQRAVTFGPVETGLPVVTDDLERTKRKLKSIGWEPTNDWVFAYRIRTTAKPRPTQGEWPPSNLGNVLAWQSVLDSRCRKKIQQRVVEAARTAANGVLILIESPLLTYGFAVPFSRTGNAKKAPNQLTQLKELFALKVLPLSVFRLDDRYMAQRNAPGQVTLAGKRISLVGCGTIGGYLADLLIKAGAGTGGGQLTLIDNDNLMPQNIGRHRLGFSDLFKNKATALSAELFRGAPGADIRALPVSAQSAHLGDIDLIIDATGEESLGHWLTARYIATSPMLTVWIEGPGTAVRSLLRGERDSACVRCLTHHTRNGRYQAVVGGTPILFAGQGCEELYVPFPATVSVQAASLGAEMALAWANGTSSPALRTKLVDTTRVLATPDCNPQRDIQCPACT